MRVYRLARKAYALPLSGEGAKLNGARWNTIGTEIIYTAETRSLAMAEVLVHLSLATLPTDFVIITIEIPDDLLIKEIKTDDLPLNWNVYPHLSSTQKFGDEFVREGKYSLLKVPSVITPGEHNFLINPKNKDFSKIQVISTEAFPFDHRLFK